jgi:hypothetical protein
MHSFGNDAVSDSVAEAVRSLPRSRSGLLGQGLTTHTIIGGVVDDEGPGL